MPFQYGRTLFVAPTVVALSLILLFGHNVEVLASAWRDPLSILAARSPGQRDAGALYNIKQKRLSLADLAPETIGPTGIVPHERVLAASRMRPDPVLAPFLPGDDALPGWFDEPIDIAETGPLPTIASLGAPGPLSSIRPVGGAPLFTVSDLSELRSTPLPTDNPPGTDMSGPVPEPSTWTTSIAGLFAVAGLMRRARRRTMRTAPAFAT
jgi:hypothetical protein